jgi:hypothetical protein
MSEMKSNKEMTSNKKVRLKENLVLISKSFGKASK